MKSETGTAVTGSPSKKGATSINLIIAPLGLILLAITFALSSPFFLQIDNISNIARQASVNIIIAVGMTIVIATGGIDLAVGSIVALSACSLAQLNYLLGLNVWAAMTVGIAIGTSMGFVSGLLITLGDIPPFIATLGMMGIGRGLALIITGGYPTMGFESSFQWIGKGEIFGIPFMFIIAIIILLISAFVSRYTKIGRHFYAIGGNEEAARYSGIDPFQVKTIAYTISGLCSGIAGVVLASRINSAPPSAGAGYELNAIAAVVIGGASLAGGEGSLPRTLLGALIMAVLMNGFNLLNVQPFVQTALIGAVIIVMVFLKNISEKRTSNK